MGEKAWDCNTDGCPGMAHPCTRLRYEAARSRLEREKDHSLAVASSLLIQCRVYEDKIAELEKELLDTYRRLPR